MSRSRQLISYIAHAAPATRRPADESEPFIRPEIGFTPKWYRQLLDIDFGERWHTDPSYRRETISAMSAETNRRFGGRTEIGCLQRPEDPLDLLTGAFGAVLVPALYGVPIIYSKEDWPWTAPGPFLDDEAADWLEPPDLDENAFWRTFLEQLDWIEGKCGKIVGFINWQGVLNNAYRLRGQEIFVDILTAPQRVERIFRCVTTTMIQGLSRLYERQRSSGVELTHVTLSNCLVNLLSPNQYEAFQLPFDRLLAESFSMTGIHNCAWNASPYLRHYSTLPNVAYMDMGLDSDLAEAKRLFSGARRALMYTPMDLANKRLDQIGKDLERTARAYGPFDLVLADIEAGTPDQRVLDVVGLCSKLSGSLLSNGLHSADFPPGGEW